MSLLSMIQSACAQQGLAQPSLVVGSSDKTAKQMLALAQVEGRELADSYTWSQLQRAFTWQLNALTLAGNITSGAATITGLSSTANLQVGFAPVVNGFTSFARIISIDSSTQVTVSENATETATATSIVFAQEAYPFPADFARFINRTQWDNAFRWELIGPISPQEWQWRKSGIIASSPRRRFRIAGFGSNQILIDPLPAATEDGQNLVFEYYTDNFSLPVQWVTGTTYAAAARVSNNGFWYSTTGGGTSGATPPTHLSGSLSDGGVTWTFQGYAVYGPAASGLSGWRADTDVGQLPEDIMALGIIWRFRKAKGMPDWEAHYQTWKSAADRGASKRRGAPTLDMTRRRRPMFITPENVPDTGFGGVSV